MLARFQNKEGAAGTGNHTAAFRIGTLPDRLPVFPMQEAGELIGQKHVGMLGLERRADKNVRRLAGADARCCGLNGRNASAFLAHEGARRSRYLVDDGDIAGEQV